MVVRGIYIKNVLLEKNQQMKSFLKQFALVLCSLLLINCSEDEATVLVLSSISISTNDGNTIVIGQTLKVDVVGADQNGDTMEVTSDINWTTDNSNITVDQNGLVRGIESGVSTLTAETQGMTSTLEITIESRVLSKISINTSNGTKLDLGETTQLSVVGFDQIDNSMEVSSTILWTSDNDNLTVGSDGLATGIEVGNSEVKAQTEGLEGTISMRIWDSTAPRTEIYVSDVGSNRNGPHQILKYDEDGENGEIFISTGLSKPQDIVFLEEEGVVIISNLSSNNITRHDINTGNFIDVFASGLNGPTRVEIGPDGYIYVIQWNGGPVKRYDREGNFIDDFTSTSINQAIGIAWDQDNNLYVSSFNNGSSGYVRKFDTSGIDQGNFINSSLQGPTDIWFDDDGNMLVNDWSGNNVQKFDKDGALISIFISGLNQPEGVDFLNGNILIGNSGNGSVKMYTLDGNFIEDIVSSGSAGLITTNAVTVRHVNQ